MDPGLRVDIAGVVPDGVLRIPEVRSDDPSAPASGHERHDVRLRARKAETGREAADGRVNRAVRRSFVTAKAVCRKLGPPGPFLLAGLVCALRGQKAPGLPRLE